MLRQIVSVEDWGIQCLALKILNHNSGFRRQRVQCTKNNTLQVSFQQNLPSGKDIMLIWLSLYHVPEEIFTQNIYFRRQAIEYVHHHKDIKKYGHARLLHFVFMIWLNIYHLPLLLGFGFSYKNHEKLHCKGSIFLLENYAVKGFLHTFCKILVWRLKAHRVSVRRSSICQRGFWSLVFHSL